MAEIRHKGKFVLKFSWDEFDPAFDVREKAFDILYLGKETVDPHGQPWTAYLFDLVQPILYVDGRLAGTRFLTSLSGPPRMWRGDAVRVMVVTDDGQWLPVGRARIAAP